jgi:hypothetical protein
MSLFVSPVVRATDANNLALSQAKWYFYVTGGTTPAAIYTTSALSGGSAHTNPVVADSAGLFAPIYLDPTVAYRAILKTSAGAVIQDIDPASAAQVLSTDEHTILWGGAPGPEWDGVSDYQAFFTQTQPTFLTNGSLGALYGQRLASYTGGAVSDLTAPVVGAVRGYNQIQSTVTYSVEVGGLFVTDNYSYISQGVGVTSQSNSRHGGRVWGAVHEAHEHPETFTATAGQTVFVVPNGFSAVAAVTKNGTLLTLTTDYTLSTPNVTLVSGATVGDTIKVYRSNPQSGIIGVETDVFAGPGTDTANAISGNRIGHAIFGYRQDKTINVAGHIGTLLAIISDPSDTTYLTTDRGIQFQGKFATGIDFTASNFSATTWLIKFTSATGIDTSGNFIPPTGTVAALPAASTALKGVRQFATDLAGATFTYGAAVAGGGSRGGPVFCNGSAWLEG